MGLRIRVPTKNTTMALGSKLAGTAYSGFSVQTDGHVFLQAKGSPGSSYAVIESEGPFVAGSQADVLMLAKQSAMVGATENVLVAGRQGVNIVAGAGASWVNDDPKDSDDVQEPQIDAVTHYNTAWTALGAATTAAMAAWKPVNGTVGNEEIEFKIGSILSASNLAYGLGSTVFNAIATYTGGPSLGETVNIDATRNVNLNALQNTSIAAGIGAGMVAPAVNIVGFATAGIFGGARAGIGSAGTTAVKGHKTAEVASGKKTVISTGPKGEASSLTLDGTGQDAHLSASRRVKVTAGTEIKGETESVAITGTEIVQLLSTASNGVVEIKAKDRANLLSENDVAIRGDNNVEIEGKSSAKLGVGDYAVEAKDTNEISIGGKQAYATFQGGNIGIKGKVVKIG